MAVLNESGARLGTVKRVQMGDPGAVTTAAEAGRSTGYGGAMAIADARGDEPEVPGPLRTTPRRVGFVEVDGLHMQASPATSPMTASPGSAATRFDWGPRPPARPLVRPTGGCEARPIAGRWRPCCTCAPGSR
jgi:hypothetical protein